MRVDGVALAGFLAARLDAVVPAGVTVAAGDDWVEFAAAAAPSPPDRGARRGPTSSRQDVVGLVDQDGDWRELVETACRGVLDACQDFVVEDLLHHGWPPSSPAAAGRLESAARMPMPDAEVVGEVDGGVDGGRVRLWYGRRARPALELEPIPLAAFTTPAMPD